MKMVLAKAVKHGQGIMSKNMFFAIIFAHGFVQNHDGMSVAKMTNYGTDYIFLILRNYFEDSCKDVHTFGFVEL